ncbi:type I methionyl aminopeptidase [Vineibacter terrae]|uniref:type I methionyl aminopeptidase n=1 Tax=Vineibacter terrae TaxID=2586908 RepID=UPI002E377300|nr:type I methionyl aminopeptidase [Vineibacter terrae]HEX2889603.1 type I methionyl aminopeptidase [Vineibacter terrae]
MTIETEEQLERLRRIGGIVAAVCRLMGSRLEPGMTTRELDEIGRAALEREGSRPAPSLMYGFPGATCISVNHAVAHGVPDDTRLAPGDMVNIDVSAERDGVFADTGASFVVPPARADQERLCRSTRKALNRAVQAVRPGRRLNIIGHTIERTASADGYTVIRNLGSHGVGDSLHDEVPGFIPGYYDRDDRRIMTQGLVFTIEPFLSTGATQADEQGDGWTLATAPGIMTAQYEHTLVVGRRGAIVVTV